MMFLYRDSRQAETALKLVREGQKTGEIKVVDAAVVQKDQDGKARFQEIHDVEAWRGTLMGMIAGALVGLLGGPAGALVGGAMGAAAGGVVAGKIDLGFSNDFLNELKTAVHPGYSVLLILVEHPWDAPLLKVIEPFPGRVFRHLLKSEAVEKLLADRDGPGTQA
jgi:uncharacterized membrane protein